jgi:hypothetical protein
MKRKEMNNQITEENQSFHNSPNKRQKISIPTKQKKKTSIFDYWTIICLTGNIFQIFASAISVFDNNNITTMTEVLIGFGCMLAFINIGRYIEYAQNYSTIYITISAALPNVFRYLIGVFPIFLGFIFFGLCLFWRSERFTSTSNVMLILFSLAQGDSVFDTFKDLSGISFFLGQIYLYLFCIIFIVVVLNIFIAIIEEAYITTKMQNKTHWVYDYIKKDPSESIVVKDPTPTSRFKNPKVGNDYSKKYSKSYMNKGEMMKLKSTQSLRNHSLLAQNEPSSFDLRGKMETFKENKERENYFEKNNVDNYEKNLELEFNNIQKNLEEIKQSSLDILNSKDTDLKDEVRTMIFDQINSLERRAEELRNILNKNY